MVQFWCLVQLIIDVLDVTRCLDLTSHEKTGLFLGSAKLFSEIVRINF